jgi:hypothetical protein
LFIAAYTLWDKQAVSRFAIAPVVLDWGANLLAGGDKRTQKRDIKKALELAREQ